MCVTSHVFVRQSKRVLIRTFLFKMVISSQCRLYRGHLRSVRLAQRRHPRATGSGVRGGRYPGREPGPVPPGRPGVGRRHVQPVRPYLRYVYLTS